MWLCSRSDVRLSEFARKLNKVMHTIVKMDSFRSDVQVLTTKHTSLAADLSTLERYAERTFVPLTRYQHTLSELMVKLLALHSTVENEYRARLAQLEQAFALEQKTRATVREDTVTALRKFERATTKYVYSELKRFEKDVHVLLLQHPAAGPSAAASMAAGPSADPTGAGGLPAAGRLHFRCLACDSLLTPPPPTSIARAPDSDSYFDVSSYLNPSASSAGGGGGGAAPAPLVHTHNHPHTHSHKESLGGGPSGGQSSSAVVSGGAPLPAMTMLVERGEVVNLRGRDGQIYRGRQDSNVMFVPPKKGYVVSLDCCCRVCTYLCLMMCGLSLRQSNKFSVAYTTPGSDRPIKGLSPPVTYVVCPRDLLSSADLTLLPLLQTRQKVALRRSDGAVNVQLRLFTALAQRPAAAAPTDRSGRLATRQQR